jgi:hypothetical protein
LRAFRRDFFAAKFGYAKFGKWTVEIVRADQGGGTMEIGERETTVIANEVQQVQRF